MPKLNAILIDFENVQPALNVLQSANTEKMEIYVFLGQKQMLKLNTESLNIIRKLGERIEFIQIEGEGNNALDFHIAYFIGKLSKEKDYSFSIISKDKGFDILIKYLEKNGINCIREEKIEDIFKQQKTKTPVQEALIQKAKSFLQHLSKMSKPKTEKALISEINNFFKGKSEKPKVQDIIKILKSENYLNIDENKKVSYALKV